MLWTWCIAALVASVFAQTPQVNIGLTLDTPSTGISTTPEGRVFLIYARIDGSIGPSIVERQNGNDTPFPNAEWNNYAMGKDPATHFVRVNSQRVGPDGALWLVDTGSPALGEPAILPGGPKLIQVNLTTNEVARVYPMDKVAGLNSFLDDIRFNPATGKAYVTDAGYPTGLIILDLESGDAIRVLDDDPSCKQYMPVSAEGNLLRDPQGELFYIYADQLEVSPDGKYLYFQPASGGMSRVETCYLDDALYNATLADSLSQYVVPYAHTPSTGGTAIDAEGNVYNSDTDRHTILKIAPNGTMSVFIEDERLIWIDAMWIDSDNKLWMPDAQLGRGTFFNNGTSRVQKPTYIYNVDLGIGPSPIDHA